MRRAACVLVITACIAGNLHSVLASNATLAPRRAEVEPSLPGRLADAALAAPSATNDDGSLYGVQRWSAATGKTYLGLKFPGLLSCAYTVSAIFRQAGHPIGKLSAVSAVDSALAAWPKVNKLEDLRPGDVVFWKPRPTSAMGLRCPSRHWHVGIAVGDGQTIDNNWWTGKPAVQSIDRLCVTFAYARRAPSSWVSRSETSQ
jgi:cell wall-associated NlpC family hydrolase